ncbi:MAG: hypothetical protein LBF80_04325 [Spirochaetaceae bacterium]|jgi:hypothetical protein|nr:hypothetical protein [Spirochaetaceae bacterium]
MDSSNTAFRSVEQWKTSLITLPDTRFFDLVRSILGNIRSPFNKQRLLDELSAFLADKDIKKTVSAYIDGDDHKVIAAIAALNEPCRGDLTAFFSGEYTYAELDSLLINLEERLIVYVVKEGGKNRLSLNPLFKKILLPFAADSAVLFPYTAECSGPGTGVFNDIFLAAFLTFIAPERVVLKSDGTPRKNLMQRIQKIFPPGADVFAAALRHIGILTEAPFDYTGQKFQDFAALTEFERFAYCAAGVYISLTVAGGALLPQKRFIRRIAAAAAALLNLLVADKCYPVTALRRIIMITAAEYPENTTAADEPLKSAVLIAALEKTGLLLKVQDGYRRRNIDRTGDDGVIPCGSNTGVIAFNSVFSFILLPEISFTGAAALAAFCEVDDAKTSVQFSVTRESAARGFNNGVDSGAMFELLTELSSGRTDTCLRETLDEWQKRHSEVVIIEGVSIVLSEGRRYIAQTEPFASHIAFSPSPGVFLLDIADRDEAAAMLKNAGVDIISEPRAMAKHAIQKRTFPFFDSITPQTESLAGKFRGRIPTPRSAGESARGDVYRRAEKRKKHFRAALNELKPSQMEREELAARIERRLIISERQLNGAFIRYEKREAHGLDYHGKLALVKQAIISNETLEIIVENLSGAEKCIRGAPLALEKAEDELTLSLKLPDGYELDGYAVSPDCVKIPMGKIRVIRRIKQSIFSN